MSNCLLKGFNVKDIRVITQGTWETRQTNRNRRQRAATVCWRSVQAECTWAISKPFCKVSANGTLVVIDLPICRGVQALLKKNNESEVAKGLSRASSIAGPSLPQLFPVQLW